MKRTMKKVLKVQNENTSPQPSIASDEQYDFSSIFFVQKVKSTQHLEKFQQGTPE